MIIPKERAERELNEREKAILRTIIHLYILNAAPVGSRVLAKYLERDMRLSPATVRNVMAELEELEYISHPHTSAGRFPTDKGYRFYVDSLMDAENLNESEILAVRSKLVTGSPEEVLRDASRVLGMISRCLGLVEIPHLKDLVVRRIELICMSSTRMLAVIALDSDIVRTVSLESTFEMDYRHLEEISAFINERVSGRPLKYLRDNFREMLADSELADTPLIRLFIESVDKLFDNRPFSERIHIAGTQNLLQHPEFEDLDKVKGIIELVENEDVIIHLLDKYESFDKNIQVLIGREMENDVLQDYSMVVSTYRMGSAAGSIGLIGPKRMNYSKMITLVGYVSRIISGNE